LRTPYASYDPWCPTLDGILGYVWWRRRLGRRRFYNTSVRADQPVSDADLPLARVVVGDEWVWACSAPVPRPPAKEALRYYHKRFDEQYERHLDLGRARRGVIQTATGPYKSHRVPLRIVATPALDWYVVGDAEALGSLLDEIQFVGKRYSHGHGEVLRWEVTPVDEDRSVVWEGRLTRPVPYAAVRQYALVQGSYAPARRGIRPPYHHPQMQRACVVPSTSGWPRMGKVKPVSSVGAGFDLGEESWYE